MSPRYHLTRRTLPVRLATAVGLWMLVTVATTTAVAVQQPPSLDLDPDSGPRGSSVVATARGFTGCFPSGDDVGSGEVAFAWDGVEVLDVVPIEDGAASTTFRVPEGATVDRHGVVARCVSDDDQSASAGFSVTPLEVPPVIVPSIIGLSASEAHDTLRAAELLLGTVTGDGDRIESQDPEPGTEAARGTPVDVIMAPVPPVLVTVPDLDGTTASGARAALDSVGLFLGSVSGDGDVVRSQDPTPGARVPVGSAVSVSLAPDTPPVRLVRVPELQGMTLDEARATVESLGLVLAHNPPGDRVASQQPAPGTLVPRSTSITLTMTAAGSPWWPGMAAVLVILAGAALTASRLLRPRLERRWLRHHVHLAPGGYAAPDLDVSESTAQGSGRTVAVRLEPHADSGTHVLEEVAP